MRRGSPSCILAAMDNAIGCDLSHYQGQSVDWEALAGAVSFVGVKASEGETNTDPMFSRNVVGARSQPFALAWFYHVARPGDARGQAKRLVDLCGQLRPNERLCLDTERTSAVGFDFLDEWFDQIYADVPDRQAFLYTSNGVWVGAQYPSAWDLAPNVALILPRYQSVHEPLVPEPWMAIGKSWAIWQQSQTGHVPGIAGPVDLDTWNGPLRSLEAFASLSLPP